MLKYAARRPCLPAPPWRMTSCSFHAPSGNIQCMIATGDYAEARCDVMDMTTKLPATARRLRPRLGPCLWRRPAGHRKVPRPAPAIPSPIRVGMTLGYGDHIDLGGFACTSEKTGMTCTNPAGHGFTIAKANSSCSDPPFVKPDSVSRCPP